MKPFDLESFKAGQKSLTRNGRVATFIGICDQCEKQHQLIVHIESDRSFTVYNTKGIRKTNCETDLDLVSMASRHQALIDAYDPEDTWVAMKDDSCTTLSHPFEWFEHYEYRLHKHNDLIKAWKRGAKIEFMEKDGTWVDIESPYWYEDSQYRIKPEPEFTYPIYKQSKYSGLVVEFTDLTTGKVLVSNNFYKVGHVQRTWIPHTDTVQWQDWTPITKSKPTIHCLAYDADRLAIEQSAVVRVKIVKKDIAVEKGWKIIHEWEV